MHHVYPSYAVRSVSVKSCPDPGVWVGLGKVAVAAVSVDFQEGQVKRIASTNGGALRVVKTPGATTSKSKSRIF